MIAFARALEVIPRQLCDNAGFDATDVLNKLRHKHALKDGSGKHFGVDVNTGACVGLICFARWVLHNHAGFVKGKRIYTWLSLKTRPSWTCTWKVLLRALTMPFCADT